jgi:chemotaxis methyl-accepting protein methylase
MTMPTRNLPARSAFLTVDPLRIDATRLKKAKRILGTDSDVETLNKALAMVISNEEMESAIEKAFGTLPYFESR